MDHLVQEHSSSHGTQARSVIRVLAGQIMMIFVIIYYWIDHLLADQIWLWRNQVDKLEGKYQSENNVGM